MPTLAHVLSGSGLTVALAVVSSACAPSQAAPVTAPAPSAPQPAVLPSEITSCEPETDASFGNPAFPLEDAVAVAEALPEYCVPRKLRVAAVRACAARLGTTKMKLGISTADKDGKGCWESLIPGEWSGRRFALGFFFFQNGGNFDGSAVGVEIASGKAALLVTNDGLGSPCDSVEHTPKDAAPGFGQLPVDLRAFLCGLNRH